MVRDPDGANTARRRQVDRGDAVSGQGLDDALDGVATAYYLIHSMGAGAGDFAQRDRRAACNFGDSARAAGVKRVIYLGGLDPAGPTPPSTCEAATRWPSSSASASRSWSTRARR